MRKQRFTVQVGPGTQYIKWLAFVAAERYCESQSILLLLTSSSLPSSLLLVNNYSPVSQLITFKLIEYSKQQISPKFVITCPSADDIQVSYDILKIILLQSFIHFIPNLLLFILFLILEGIELIKEPQFLAPHTLIHSVLEEGQRVCVLLSGEDESRVQHLESSNILLFLSSFSLLFAYSR